MKKLLFISLLLFVASCSSPLDNKLSLENFEKVKVVINKSKDYSSSKKRYIIDNLEASIGMLQLAKAMQVDPQKNVTFRSQVEEFSTDYDSIFKAKTKAKKDAEKLNSFLKLSDASVSSQSEYKGSLSMTLDFNNNFEKDVLYIIMDYKYIDEYDSKFFHEQAKLTDKVANNFKDQATIFTTEEYNDVAKFMYKKVPVRASKSLRDELGDDAANKKVERDFLMKGLKISTKKIVFKDKTTLSRLNTEWDYFDN